MTKHKNTRQGEPEERFVVVNQRKRWVTDVGTLVMLWLPVIGMKAVGIYAVLDQLTRWCEQKNKPLPLTVSLQDLTQVMQMPADELREICKVLVDCDLVSWEESEDGTVCLNTNDVPDIVTKEVLDRYGVRQNFDVMEKLLMRDDTNG